MFQKSSHQLLQKISKRWGQASFCSIIVLAGTQKVEWADHVLPICQLITFNRCLKENCSYFTQHWMLQVHMPRKDGHGKNRKCFITDFFIYKRHPCAALFGGSYLLCRCDLGLIWTCWCSPKRTLHSVWACLPWDTEAQSRILCWSPPKGWQRTTVHVSSWFPGTIARSRVPAIDTSLSATVYIAVSYPQSCAVRYSSSIGAAPYVHHGYRFLQMQVGLYSSTDFND